MAEDPWSAVDDFFAGHLLEADPILDQALAASHDAGLPSINVAPNQGKMLHLMVRMAGARRVLEIGTLGAYSTIWLARALPAGGQVVSLEADPAHARVARANIARAGLDGVIELHEGKALDILPRLSGPFDFVFVDADKNNNPAYYEWALKLTRPGAVLVFDNVVRRGLLLDPRAEEKVLGNRRLAERLNGDSRVSATAIQTVGAKGWDGFILAVVN